jgi:DNA-binding LytR/AlgR family response regulator
MHKILVVDDEKKSRDFISDLITSFIPDSEITQADNPLTALELIKQHPYDLLFSDIEMPQMSGLDMIEKIKNTGKEIYIVLISAYNKFEYAQKAIEIGASGYILKPFRKEYVEKVIQPYLEAKTQLENQEIVLINKSDNTFPVKIEDIIAIEKTKRNYLTIHTKTDCLQNIRGTLNEMANQFPSNFMYINRQCVVNLHAISRINCNNDVFLSKENLSFPCSRENRKRLLSLLNPCKNEK